MEKLKELYQYYSSNKENSMSFSDWMFINYGSDIDACKYCGFITTAEYRRALAQLTSKVNT
jgi:hypothetical protein